MGQFKKYLKENDALLVQIGDALEALTAEEIDEFGAYLYDTFFEEDTEYENQEDEYEEESEEEDSEETEEEYECEFDKDDVLEMIQELGEEFYEDILWMLDVEDEDDTSGAEDVHGVDPEEQRAEIAEGVSRRMKQKNLNRKKRKFMKKSKATLRKTKAMRKRKLRVTRAKRRRYYRTNKAKLASYKKSRNANVRKGKHFVKLRRAAG